MKPLEGIVVLELCQYLAGPSAGLRLADLGARVIKVERPNVGEGGRRIATKNLYVGDDSLTFHTINRNKESITADLKKPADLETVKDLIKQSDVMTHNFRPGVMERIGLDYSTVNKINDRIIYGVVTGYGQAGPWAAKAGQDLLVQCTAGLCQLTGNKSDPPVPMGLAVADTMCGNHLVHAILTALIERGKTGKGSKVEVSLLESTIDFQFEVLTTYLNDGHTPPERAADGSAHAYLSAPYGVYPTREGYLAIAMNPLTRLFDLIGVTDEYRRYMDDPFANRDEIMTGIREALAARTAAEWTEMLQKAGIWCSEVFNYDQILSHEAYERLDMEQDVRTDDGEVVRTTRCPIRIDGERYFSKRAAPRLGNDTDKVLSELLRQ